MFYEEKNENNASEGLEEHEIFENLEDALDANLETLYESDFAEPDDPDEENPDVRAFRESIDTEDHFVDPDYDPESDTEIFDENDTAVPDVPDELDQQDEAIIHDISDALANQIKAEIKREKRIKRLKRSRWWLLSLIPVLGIFVLLIRPLRKHMPKWFMILRTLIFLAFSIEVIGVVATDGRMLFYQMSAFAKNRMGKKFEAFYTGEPDVTPGVQGLSDPALSSVYEDEEGFLNTLIVVSDSLDKKISECFIGVYSVNKEACTSRLVALMPNVIADTESLSGSDKASKDADPQQPLSYYAKLYPESIQGSVPLELLCEKVSALLDLHIDGWIYMDLKGLEKLADKLGGLAIDEEKKLSGKEAVAYFSDSSEYRFNDKGVFSAFARHYELFTAVSGSFKSADNKKRFFTLNELAPYMLSNMSKKRITDNIEFLMKNEVSRAVYLTVPNGLNYETSADGSCLLIKDTERLKEEADLFVYGEREDKEEKQK